MEIRGKAQRIRFGDFRSPQMRAFHMTWFAFFLCFFAWFGIAPLMHVVRAELALDDEQVGWCIIASVSATAVARLFVGRLCDRFGPRRTYSWLLILGSLPVMASGLAQDFVTFVTLRLLVGMIGASFVVTQYHTSLMFAPSCVGMATATTAGWGNLGGAATQVLMPLLLAGFTGIVGTSVAVGWRLSMLVAGLVCMATGVAYYALTQDAPEGDFHELRQQGKLNQRAAGSLGDACRDRRVWALFAIYGASFGVELTMYNVAALYFIDTFGTTMTAAGLITAGFGAANLFARTLGGFVSDKLGRRSGMRGRVRWLFVALLCEGLALVLLSRAQVLWLAVTSLIVFGVFVMLSEGATFAVVPFVKKGGLGAVAGIVAAGGNVGAMVAGFVFKGSLPWSTALLVLGGAVCAISLLTFAVAAPTHATESAVEERADLVKHVLGVEADRRLRRRLQLSAWPGFSSTRRRRILEAFPGQEHRLRAGRRSEPFALGDLVDPPRDGHRS